MSTSIVAAHVSCCSFPQGFLIPNLWMTNFAPLMSFLEASGQGLFGQVTDIKGNPLPKAIVKINGQKDVVLSEQDASFSVPLPEGRVELSLSLENYESKTVGLTLNKGERIRKKVVLDHIFGEDLVYHPPNQIPHYMEKLSQKYHTLSR
jgi:hypothetical protein